MLKETEFRHNPEAIQSNSHSHTLFF